MKRTPLALLALFLLIPALALAGDANTIAVTPTMKLNMNLQSLVTVPVGDQAAITDFSLKRFRLILSGDVVADKVGYLFQGEGLNDIFLVDMKILFKNYLPHTTVAVGRFLPNYTLYQPKSTAQLNLVNYPLTTLRYASWRQVGFESKTSLNGFDLTLGVFNGIDVTDNWSDNNDAKDFLGRLDYSFEAGGVKATVGAYDWYGFANGTVYTSAGDLSYTEELSINRMGLFLTGEVEGFRFAGEYLAATQTMPEVALAASSWSRTAGVGTSDVSSRAIFAEVMYRMGTLEGLLRWDDYDPNMDVDDNGESWITAGVNYYLPAKGSMVFLNYVKKSEQGTEVDNDQVLIQFQVAF